MHGLAPAPPADESLRDRHRALVDAKGRDALHAELAAVDAASAERLYPNDFVRVSRALEVFELTGKPMSVWQKEHGFRERRFDARLVGLGHERDALDERIRTRVRGMLGSGWHEEVRDLLACGFGDARAMAAVGYRQVREAVESSARADENEDELVDSIVRATRIFARRQRTWLRDEPVRWLDKNDANDVTLDGLMSEAPESHSST